MKQQLMTFFTLSPLHIGCGSDVGVVDQPVLRERHTDWPVIPGSTIKGVISDLFLDKTEAHDYVRSARGEELLGTVSTGNKAKAGTLSIGEGVLLAFPVRSARGCFAWVTCPMALQRFAKAKGCAFAIPTIESECCLAGETVKIGEDVVLEEYKFAVKGKPSEDCLAALKALTAVEIWQGIGERLVILSDDAFTYFVRNTCEIANHNRIDDVTGVVADGALFSQENVPSEVLFWSVIRSKNADDLTVLKEEIAKVDATLQVGADASTGLGYCAVTFVEA